MDSELLGIDEEEAGRVVDPTVADPTVTAPLKRRRPQVKLTAERLIGEKGLPYVMKNAPKRVRISKRRNAHDNLSHIVQFYQLWAHELFPKARFNDFIKLCQSLGKNDKLLREYRKNLYREELLGGSERHEETILQDTVAEEHLQRQESIPQDIATQAPQEAQRELEELEDDIYTVSTRANAAELDTQQPIEDESHEEAFEEDQDAMEAMKEFGF